MKPQIITTPNGERLVVLPLEDYEALRALAEEAEDAADSALAEQLLKDLDEGRDELMPEEVSRHLLSGDSLVKSIRRWRGMTQAEVAEKAGIGQGYISEIESREKKGTEETLTRIATALDVPAKWLV
jgi:ribosome-binding protein aMBF1 (putative translation factor)